MGIIRGSHFYLHLITQKRPEYIIGILPPKEVEEPQTIFHSFEKIGSQSLKSIYHITIKDAIKIDGNNCRGLYGVFHRNLK